MLTSSMVAARFSAALFQNQRKLLCIAKSTNKKFWRFTLFSSVLKFVDPSLPPLPRFCCKDASALVPSPFPGRANQRFHVIQIALQRLASRRGQPVFRLGRASMKRLLAGDIVGVFQLARVH